MAGRGYDVFHYEASGWGGGELVVARDGRLVLHELAGPGGSGHDDGHPLGARFAAYLTGAEDDFLDVELDLDGTTPFELAVTERLRRLPRGETVAYGELAALSGRPRAGRAVGTICAGNAFSLIVPCHRVVAAGGIGSYGSAGVAVKERLLRLEGVDVGALR